ncbi:hypothetical protein GCM10007857_55860 [Bradyrhizobium iriomotense]|uniref:Sialate O-acetylesterase domain-containing protein n=2 Tax=Bradyrhizobium iriomotense TaxID=441950 RepID=A0ABQ6B459_9BRAD|nr:hypothetical protein GCM10007857_55860 [Bradyrhizobium iriomotense]
MLSLGLNLSSVAAFAKAAPVAQDIAPAAYRSTTQTYCAGQFNGGSTFLPPFGAEWSVSIWARMPPSTTNFTGGYIFNIAVSGTTQSKATGDGTEQQLALGYSGTVPLSNSGNRFKFFLAGTDKALTKISTTSLNGTGIDAAAFGISSEAQDDHKYENHPALYTVQYRSGNIEVWQTFRSERPRLIMSKTCTFTGFDSPRLSCTWGTLLNLQFNSSVEVEMPIYMPDRSLSENEIAQIADGINPVTLGNFANAHPFAVMRFASISNGGSTGSDTSSKATPNDGKTVTLNGQVFTFKDAPVDPVLDIQTATHSVASNASVSSTTDVFTKTAHGLQNDWKVTVSGSKWTSGLPAAQFYYVVNAAADTWQLSLTQGGAALDIANGSSVVDVNTTPETISKLVARLNSLTPLQGGASDAQYIHVGSDGLAIKHRNAGPAGEAFAFDTTCTSKMPTAKHLSCTAILFTDAAGFVDGMVGSYGVTRTRNNAWVTTGLGELAPNTQVTGSVRIDSWACGTVIQHKGAIGYFNLTGIFTGATPGGVLIKVTDLSSGSVVQDWTSVTGFAADASAKTWSGRFACPKGKRWLSFQLRKLGSSQVTQQSTVPIGVGEVVIQQGDSIQGIMGSLCAGTVTPNGFISRYNYSGSGSWQRMYGSTSNIAVLGAGEAVYANKLSNDGDCVVGIISVVIGGSRVSNFTGARNLANVNAALNKIALCDTSQVACKAGWYIWDQGAADSGSGYGAKLDSLYSWVRTNFGNDIVFGEVFLSNRQPNAADATQGYQSVRKGQVDWIASKIADPLIVALCDDHFFWSNTTDGAHPKDATDMELRGEMQAMSMLKYRGVSAYDGFGPMPVSATRSGAVIDVKFQHNGGTGLQTWQAGNVTGFDVVKASVGFNPSYVATFAAVDATADTISWSGNPAANGDKVIISPIATMPGGIARGTAYYIVNKSGDSVQLATTPGGSPIDITSNGSSACVFGVTPVLDISSAIILDANTVRITLATDPGEAVQVNYLWGMPGRKTIDPDPRLSVSGREAMTSLTAQSNILFDNYAMAYASTHLPGRPARPTSSAPLQTAA